MVRIIRERDQAALEPWLEQAKQHHVGAIRTFAASLVQEQDAVQAALEEPWSNGQVEGQITKLKMLKRTMYGRANHDLLEARMCAPP